MKTTKFFIHRATMTLLAMLLTVTTAWAETISVQFQTLVADEWKARTVNATVLTGEEEMLPWGYYVVNHDIHFNHGVQFSGNVYIILADGCTMTMGSTQNRIGNFGLYGSAGTASDNYGSDYELYIYGQSQQTGRLEIYSSTTKSNVACIKVKELFVFGGKIQLNGYNGINTSSAGQGTFIYNGNVSFSSLKEYGKGIDCDRFYMSGGSLTFNGLAQKAIYSKNFTMSGGSITVDDAGEIISKDLVDGTFSMTGGSLSVNGLGKEINARTITLGLTKDGDQIKAGNYAGTVTVETGKKLMDYNDNTALYYGTLSDDQKNAIKGKTLVPAKFDGTGTEQNPYVIHTAKGWDTFCEMFGTSAAPNDFNNVYVKLGNDISVTTMSGTSSHPFKGHFDGGGHTLTVDYHVDNEHFIAPFRYVDGATIKNLNIEGTIYASAMKAAGLIGEGTFNTTTITNCRVSAVITGGDQTGGLISSGKVKIDHCVFNGKFNNSYYHGGFIGHNNSSESSISNCLFDPQSGSNYSNTFYYYYSGIPAPTITNCYYTTQVVTDNKVDNQAKLAHRITADPGANMKLTGDYGVQFGTTCYAADGETVYLTLKNPGTPPDGYTQNDGNYMAGSQTLPFDGTYYTLVMGNEDVRISAFTLDTYNITYNLNDGSWGGIVPPTTYNILSDDVLLPAPAKDGNSFMGWYEKDKDEEKGWEGDPVSCIPAGSTGDKTFYARWEPIRTMKSLTACTAEVPNPIYHQGYTHSYFYDGTWNSNHGGIRVFDGDKELRYYDYDSQVDGFVGDYRFSMLESLDGGNCENLGEHCRVILTGEGDYEGILTADVVIVPVAGDNGTWGSLSWAFDGGAGTLTITGSGTMKELDENDPIFPWEQYGSYISTIILDNNITSIAAKAFAGTQDMNPYSSVTSIKRRTGTEGNYTYSEELPTSLTSIGDHAFAYCINATITIPSSVTTFGTTPFNQVKCVVGSLSDTGNNSTLIEVMAPAKCANVTLSGRTLWKDGNWNTLCLPFDMSNAQVTAQLAPNALMELDVDGYYDAQNRRYTKDGDNYFYGQTQYTGDTSGFHPTGFDATSGKLYLYFKDATSIEAGKPYIIKWTKPNSYVAYTGDNADACSDLVSPEFTGVKVWSYDPATKATTSGDSYVTFQGIYSPTNIYTSEKTNLYLGTSIDNNGTPDDDTDDTTVSTLYYPWGDAMTSFNVNAFRAYFQLNNGLEVGTPAGVKEFKLNFDGSEDSADGIGDAVHLNDRGQMINDNAIYNLAGQRLSKMQRGINIVNGKKVVVK